MNDDAYTVQVARLHALAVTDGYRIDERCPDCGGLIEHASDCPRA